MAAASDLRSDTERCVGPNPTPGTAEVAKLVDVLALGASGVTHGSSNLPLGTKPDIVCDK